MAASRTFPTPRQIDFSLFRGDARLVEGSFSITGRPAISCFGKNREIAIKGKQERAVFYEGAIFEHRLHPDGSAALDIKYYVAEPELDDPIWYRQTLELKAVLNMGPEAGKDKLESVVLGNSYELVYRSHALA